MPVACSSRLNQLDQHRTGFLYQRVSIINSALFVVSARYQAAQEWSLIWWFVFLCFVTVSHAVRTWKASEKADKRSAIVACSNFGVKMVNPAISASKWACVAGSVCHLSLVWCWASVKWVAVVDRVRLCSILCQVPQECGNRQPCLVWKDWKRNNETQGKTRAKQRSYSYRRLESKFRPAYSASVGTWQNNEKTNAKKIAPVYVCKHTHSHSWMIVVASWT